MTIQVGVYHRHGGVTRFAAGDTARVYMGESVLVVDDEDGLGTFTYPLADVTGWVVELPVGDTGPGVG